MPRILFLVLFVMAGCAEGDSTGIQAQDAVIRPLPDVSLEFDGGDGGSGEGDADSCVPSREVCNGLDDDCDGEVDEELGQETCGLGACEVTVDACADGVEKTCNPGTPNPQELCDGIDDDCDGEVDEECECLSNTTQSCFTGPMSARNVGVCVDGVQTCDVTGHWGPCDGEVLPSLEFCDGMDNDCDPLSSDGSGDPLVGEPCDGADIDACPEGVTECTSGTLTCSDTTISTFEVCNGVDDDCDGSVDEELTRDSNPSCSSGFFELGSIGGDSGSDSVSDAWYSEEWYRFRLLEDSTSSIYLSATISLVSAPGTDFDLYVYCQSCGGSLAGSSTTTGTDIVHVKRNDSFAVNDDFDVIVEVRHKSSSVCGDYTLNVQGNPLLSGSETCP